MAQAGAALALRALQPRNSAPNPSADAMLRRLDSSGCARSLLSCARVFNTSKGVVMAPDKPPASAPAAAGGQGGRQPVSRGAWQAMCSE